MFIWIEASLAYMACSSNDLSKKLGFEQCMAYVRVFRSIENGRAAITGVVYVDDFFVGQKEMCDRLCADLNRTIPVKNLFRLECCGGCHCLRDCEKGTPAIF